MYYNDHSETLYNNGAAPNIEVMGVLYDPNTMIPAPKKPPPKKNESRTIGVRGKVLDGQVREIIDRVARFMEKEAKEGLQIPIKSYRERVLAATGISKNTLLRIRKEGKRLELNAALNNTASLNNAGTTVLATTSFSTPGKKRPRKKMSFSPQEAREVRNIIYDYYFLEKKSPTVKVILQIMKERQFNFAGSAETLRRLIKSIGFRWCKTKDNKKVLKEKHDTPKKRKWTTTAV